MGAKRGSVQERFWRHVVLGPGCWLWSGSKSDKGYGRLSVAMDGGRRPVVAPRISWEIHFGPIPPSMFVLHRCDVPACVRPDHLFLGTLQDNNADMLAKGRAAQGERRGHAKLTVPGVEWARRMYQAKALSAADLAFLLGVGRQTLCRALNGSTWKSAPGEVMEASL